MALTLAPLLAACVAAPQPDAGAWPNPAATPRRLDDVPHHPQEALQCGPAALASVLQYSGVDVSVNELTERVFLPGRRGSLQVDLVAATRERERLAYPLHGGLPALLRELDAGLPVLVLQNRGLDRLPNWHYAVVTGYDPEADRVYLHSGSRAHLAVPSRLFLKTWRRAAYWGLVVPPPGRLPASAAPLALLQAIAGLEQTGRIATATKVMDLALERWPGEAPLHAVAGNLDLTAARNAAAARHFLAALELEPGYAAAWNNLAYALSASQCRREALLAARCATRLEPDSPAIADTVQQMNAQAAAVGDCYDGSTPVRLEFLLDRSGCDIH